MTTNSSLNALIAAAELPFGHPGRRFDDTPEYFDHSPLANQGPEPDYTPDEEGGVVHYAPATGRCTGTRASPRSTPTTRIRSPAAPKAITAQGGVAWLAPGGPEALPALREAGMVTTSKGYDDS